MAPKYYRGETKYVNSGINICGDEMISFLRHAYSKNKMYRYMGYVCLFVCLFVFAFSEAQAYDIIISVLNSERFEPNYRFSRNFLDFQQHQQSYEITRPTLCKVLQLCAVEVV